MTAGPITRDDIQAFVDDRLDAARRVEVEAHLAAHADTRARVERMRALGDRLRAALAPAAAEPVPARLDMRRIVEARRRPRVLAWRAAAAAALLAVGGLSGWTLRGGTSSAPTGLDALAQEASANFAVYAPDRMRPVEPAAVDGDDLAGWFSARFGRAIVVPDLSGSGYRSMGGRLVATPHGPAALLMYGDDRGTRLAVLIRPMAQPGDLPMREHRSGSATSYAWSRDGLGYGLVGAASPAVLHPLADAIRRTAVKDT